MRLAQAEAVSAVDHNSGEFNEQDARYQVKLLAFRVDNLGKEKEALERELEEERRLRSMLEERVAAMEKTFQRGAGALIVLPVIGTVIGILFAWGKVIFAPWLVK